VKDNAFRTHVPKPEDWIQNKWYDAATKLIFTTPAINLGLCFALPWATNTPVTLELLAWLQVFIYIKVGFCMSILLHRLFSHKSFICSRPAVFVFGVLACLSGQRGPLWWSSKHRRHHRFSDTANDPHSAAVDGIWYGLAGWYTDKSELQVDVPFVVPSLLTPELAVLDRLFFIPNLIEYAVLYHFFGWAVALYVGFASSTISLCATLWFNLEFHSGEESGSGYGTAVDATWSMFARLFLGAFLINFGIYVVSGSPIWFATLPIYLAYFLVGEHKHNHHHQHPNAAKRPGVDPFASTVMRGLAALGVVEWRPENWYK